MVDRTLVTSGFDIEALVSERYLEYVLLAQIEAGRLGTRFDIVDAERGIDLTLTLHPPTDYQRRYEPSPAAPLPDGVTNSLQIELLPEDEGAFLRVRASVSVEDRAGGQSFDKVPAGMLLDVALESETTDLGLEQGHELALTLVQLEDGTRNALRTFGVDPEAAEAALRPLVDRRIPIGISRGQRVQQLRLRRHTDSPSPSLGVYLDLALRDGPREEDLIEARGDVSLAQDFRAGGMEIAFSTSPGLFALLGPDMKFRQAEENEDGTFSFPLRKNPLDPDSEVLGRIKNITVGPRILVFPDKPPVVTGELQVKLHGEYDGPLVDPDFDLFANLKPTIEDGVVDLELDVNVQLGLLATLLLVAGGIILTALFAPGLAWGSTVVAGSLIGVAVLRGLIAEPLAAKLIEDRVDEDAEASFLDVLPFRLPAARRRWDPFYSTEHQVVALVDEVIVDRDGLAFEAGDVVLDKQPVPVNHVVIRDATQEQDGVSGLSYRVRDFAGLIEDFSAEAPGTDRASFTRRDAEDEPTLVDLDLEQIAERIETGRLLAPITCTPERIHLVDNQIDRILTLSRRERAESRQRVINRFRAERREALLEVFGDGLIRTLTAELEVELGRPPTDEELRAAIDAFLAPVLAQLQSLFEQTPRFARLVEEEVARNLRLELAPEHYVALQEAGILVLDGKEIIVRRGDGDTITPYYRDRPDGNPRDNLLALPTYSPPFAPTA